MIAAARIVELQDQLDTARARIAELASERGNPRQGATGGMRARGLGLASSRPDELPPGRQHGRVARLLIVHHTPSPATAELLDAAVTGARDPEISGVEVVRRAALSAGAADVLAADAVLLGTPANIGYMSGALKHFFDVVYYPVLDDTRGLPYGLYVHGNLDTAGAITAVETIAGALGWQRVAPPVEVRGHPDAAARAACAELAATLAATVMPD